MLFPNDIFKHILSYITTPMPFKEGHTYYVSYTNVWGRPHFEKIEITQICTYYLYDHASALIRFLKIPFRFDTRDWDESNVEYGSSYQYLNKLYRMYSILITPELPALGIRRSIVLYSKHTTDEKKAFSILVSRLNRYSDWFVCVKEYCDKHGILL